MEEEEEEAVVIFCLLITVNSRARQTTSMLPCGIQFSE